MKRSSARAFTLIELMIVIAIIGILTSTISSMYMHFVKKSRTAEIPLVLRSIIEEQISYKNNPGNGGNYAATLSALSWHTHTGGESSSTYDFATTNLEACSTGSGLALASAKNPSQVLEGWDMPCMTLTFNIVNIQ